MSIAIKLVRFRKVNIDRKWRHESDEQVADVGRLSLQKICLMKFVTQSVKLKCQHAPQVSKDMETRSSWCHLSVQSNLDFKCQNADSQIQT